MTHHAAGALAVCLAFVVPAVADTGASGTPLLVPQVGSLSWADMLRHDAERAHLPPPVAIPAPHMPLPRGHELLPGPPEPANGASTSIQPSAPERGSCVGLGAPVITDDFLAIEDQGFIIPPDTMGAVGPNHLVTMLNDRVRIQDRAGNQLSTVFLATFWSPASAVSPFDPLILYDQHIGRFIACVDSARRSGASAVLFAISRTNDPTGTWDFYSLDADPTDVAWCDFPRMGYNATWIAITNNMFSVAADAFRGVSMWVIDVASVLPPGGPIVVTRFDYGFDLAAGVFGAPLVPASTHDPAQPTLWIIDATGFTSGGTQLHRLSRITGTGPAPVWSVAPGSFFAGTGLFAVGNNYASFTPGAAQSGTATLISANDARALDADFRNGALWYTHAGGYPAGSPTRTSSFWYQVSPGALPGPIVQSGLVDAPGQFHIFPSLAVNCDDDMMIGFSRSSTSMFIEAAFTHRLGADAPGTTRPVQSIKAGEDVYIRGSTVRWGDYSATVIDPNDDRCMWTIQEYARLDVGPLTSDDRWGTWWASLCDLAPCPGDIDGDGDTDVFDFAILAPNFALSGFPPYTNGDLDGDGDVDVFDFSLFAPDFACTP